MWSKGVKVRTIKHVCGVKGLRLEPSNTYVRTIKHVCGVKGLSKNLKYVLSRGVDLLMKVRTVNQVLKLPRVTKK